MILPDFILPSRVNQHWEYSGLDSIEHCLNKKHFKSYPHKIEYRYNSQGFRDAEWPDTLEELKNSIWCIGDSFTVGLGSPIEHTWPWLLQQQIGCRVINVSMDGASNNWIARQTNLIQKQISPVNIVIMWSYIHRRENKDCNLDDEQRRIYTIASTDVEDIDNLKSCFNLVKNNNVTQLSVPDSLPIINPQEIWNTIRGQDWPLIAPNSVTEMLLLPKFVQTELKEYFKLWDELQQLLEFLDKFRDLDSDIIKVKQLDRARDGHHFDIVTAQWVVDQIKNNLAQQDCL
jgi:hypothetical protein